MSPTLPPSSLPSALPPSNSTTVPILYHPFFPGSNNNTGYYSDEEEQDPGFSEIETVALACFLTLLPLIFGLISYLGFKSCSRHCWLRLSRTVEPSELNKEERSSHALLNEQQPAQTKSSEPEFSVLPTIEDGGESGNQTSKLAANGSVITMTMKNNHLIVETEERLEEKGAAGGGDVPLESVVTVPNDSAAAIVHVSSPTKPEPQAQEGANTGLSTSDLSSSSEASNTNRGYKYGNQEEYRGEEEFLVRETGGDRGLSAALRSGSLPRPSLDLGLAPQGPGHENPAFQPTTPAEPAAS